MHASRAPAKQNCGPAERKQRGPLCLCFVFKSMHFPSLISNTMLLKHAGVYAQPLHSSLPSTQAFSLLYVHLQQHRYPALLCPLEVKCDHSLALHTHPKTALIPGPEMQSASTLDRVFLSAPPGWGAVNTTTTENENHSFPPCFSYQGTTSSHRPSSGQTAIKTPVFWWRGGHAPTADLYTWFLSVHLLNG